MQIILTLCTQRSEKGPTALLEHLNKTLMEKQRVVTSIEKDIKTRELEFLLDVVKQRRHNKFSANLKTQLNGNPEVWIEYLTKNYDLQKQEDQLLSEGKTAPDDPTVTLIEDNSAAVTEHERRQLQFQTPLFISNEHSLENFVRRRSKL